MLLFIDFQSLGLTSMLTLWIPVLNLPKSNFCRDIENYVVTKFSSLFSGFCRVLQFSIATEFCAFFLDYVVIDNSTNFLLFLLELSLFFF